LDRRGWTILSSVFVNICSLRPIKSRFDKHTVHFHPKFSKQEHLAAARTLPLTLSRNGRKGRDCVNKHLMTGPKGNSEFCFPKTLKCSPTQEKNKKNCENMICTSSSRAELSCRNDNTITVYFFAADKSKEHVLLQMKQLFSYLASGDND